MKTNRTVSFEDYIELALDEADYEAETTDVRLTHEEVFGRLRQTLKEI